MIEFDDTNTYATLRVRKVIEDYKYMLALTRFYSTGAGEWVTNAALYEVEGDQELWSEDNTEIEFEESAALKALSETVAALPAETEL